MVSAGDALGGVVSLPSGQPGPLIAYTTIPAHLRYPIPSWSPRQGRGMAYFMMQQESLALSDFDRSYQCDQSNYRALNYRAMVLRRMGYVENALECFTLSLEISPLQADVFFLRAQTLTEVDRQDEAAGDLRRALELDPAHADAAALLEKIS